MRKWVRYWRKTSSRRISASTARLPDQLLNPADFICALRQDFSGYLVSLGLLNLGNLLLLPLIAAYLTPSELGLFSLLEAAQLQGVTLALLGLKFAYLYFYAQSPAESRPALLATSLILCATAGLAVGGLLAAAFSSPTVMDWFDASAMPAAWLLAPLLVSGAVQTMLLTELRAARRVWFSGAIAVCQLALWMLLSVIAVVYGDLGLVGLLGAQALAQSLAAGAVLAVTARHIAVAVTAGLPRGLWSKLLRYGVPMMGGLMLHYALDTSCRFLLAALVSIEAAGQFMIANRIASLFEALLSLPFFMAWGGLVHHALRRPAAAAIIGQVSSIALTSSAVLLLVLLFAQDALFSVLAGGSMPHLAGVFASLVLIKAIQLAKSPLSAGILLTGRTGWAVRNNLFALAVFLLLAYPAAQFAGLTGIAVALLGANIVAAGTLIVAARRHCPQHVRLSAIGLAGFAVTVSVTTIAYGGAPALIWVTGLLLVIMVSALLHRNSRVADRM